MDGLNSEDTTWEDLIQLQQQYPHLDLKDKIPFDGRGYVMYPIKVNAKNVTMMKTENVSRAVRDQLIEPSLSGDQDRSEPHGAWDIGVKESKGPTITTKSLL